MNSRRNVSVSDFQPAAYFREQAVIKNIVLKNFGKSDADGVQF